MLKRRNKTQTEVLKIDVHFRLNLHLHILQPSSLRSSTWPSPLCKQPPTHTALQTHTLIPKQLSCQPAPRGVLHLPGLQCHSGGPVNGARHQIGRSGWRVGLPAILKLQSASWGGQRAVTQQCDNLSQEVLQPSRELINTQFEWSDKQRV